MLPDSALCIDCRVGKLMEFEIVQTPILYKYLIRLSNLRIFFCTQNSIWQYGSYFFVHANSRNMVCTNRETPQFYYLESDRNLNELRTWCPCFAHSLVIASTKFCDHIILGPQEGQKIGGGGIIGPPLIEIGLKHLPKSGRAIASLAPLDHPDSDGPESGSACLTKEVTSH